MSKQILIVGGGLSGLTALHHLRKKFAACPDVHIVLLEKKPSVGGSIATRAVDGFHFETGPNGFLDSKSSTLDLVRDLKLDGELLPSSTQTKIRYICLGNTLHALPTGPQSFFRFQPLSLKDKLRVAAEFFVPRGDRADETVYEFGARRLGVNFSRYFLDPMVRGVFGGDARALHLTSAFPRIREIEQTYGSLFKGMICLSRKKKKSSLGAGQPAGQLWSLKNGMGQLIRGLQEKYADDIFTGEAVLRVETAGEGFAVETASVKFFADELILAAPAYEAAAILKGMHKDFSEILNAIPYVPIVVAGLAYSLQDFASPPAGFGYVIPSDEKREVLGVLFSSNIFANRAPDGQVLLQVMIGGAHHPEAILKTDQELIALACQEAESVLKIHSAPQKTFLDRWERAIPQYNRDYPQIRNKLDQILESFPNLHLLANYLGGIAMNDCTKNAKALVDKINC